MGNADQHACELGYVHPLSHRITRLNEYVEFLVVCYQDMAARIESLENQLMQGKISPDRYEAARTALEKLGEEQQRTRQLHNKGSSKSSEHDAKEAIRRLRAIKTETEAALLQLSEQLSRGELSPQEFEAEKAKIRANMESETTRLSRVIPSSRTDEHSGGKMDSDNAAQNAQMLRQAGEARRAAAAAAQTHYAGVRYLLVAAGGFPAPSPASSLSTFLS